MGFGGCASNSNGSANGLGQTILATNRITGITDNSEQTVLTYTADVNDAVISSIECSGTIYGRFNIYRNLTRITTLRTSPGNLNVVYQPIDITNGDIIDVKIFHVNTANTGDFEATIRGVES